MVHGTNRELPTCYSEEDKKLTIDGRGSAKYRDLV